MNTAQILASMRALNVQLAQAGNVFQAAVAVWAPIQAAWLANPITPAPEVAAAYNTGRPVYLAAYAAIQEAIMAYNTQNWQLVLQMEQAGQ